MAGFPRRALAGPPLEVAPTLLGALLRSTTVDGEVAVRLTEVEAYDGARDPGSHAYRGRTARNAVMFGEPGHAYVYFTYGMHFCCNIVCRPDGTAGAVLLRAGEVVTGTDLARSRRATARRDRDLARGPANLARALGLDRDWDGVDVCAAGSALRLECGDAVAGGRIRTGPRVGLRAAADRPWRFWVVDDPTVSKYRPAAGYSGSDWTAAPPGMKVPRVRQGGTNPPRTHRTRGGTTSDGTTSDGTISD